MNAGEVARTGFEGKGDSRPRCIEVVLEVDVTRLSASGPVVVLAAAAVALNEVGGAGGLGLVGAVPGRDDALLRPKLKNFPDPPDGGDEGAVTA